MRLSRTTGVGAGLLIVGLGIWAGIIPFVGPYFGYGFEPESAWHFTLDRLWLDILPAAAAVLGGLTIIAAGRRGNGVLGCTLALAGGAWLLLGPSVSMFWQHPPAGTLISGIGTPIGGHDRAAAEMIGFFYGAGALIAALSAFAAGRFVERPALIADPLAADEAAGVTARGRGGESVGRRPWAGARRGPEAQPEAGREPAAGEAEPARNGAPAGDVGGRETAGEEAPPLRR